MDRQGCNMNRLFFTLGIIAFGLILGYILKQVFERGFIQPPLPLPELRKILQKFALWFVMPVTFMGAIWIVEVDDLRVAAMPGLGAAALLLGGAAALILARIMKLTRRQTGSFFACGSFTNLGAMGGLVVFVFLGEAGYALVPLYKLLEEMVYYTIGFPVARYFSAQGGDRVSAVKRIKTVLTDPFFLVALVSIGMGGVLNLTEVPRPEFYKTVNAVFVPFGAIVLLTSIGLAMRFSSIREYLRESLAVAGIKFLLVPITITAMAWALGYCQIENGLPLKVVMLLSAMPVAFNSLVPPSLYDLNIDLANACWLLSTLALIIVLPVLYLVLQWTPC
jgi:predicted permease